MTKQTHEFNESAFTTDFFEYDVSKYRTKTAVPFHQQGLVWTFADYEKPEFSVVDELDSIYRYVSEVDANLAEEFAANAKNELAALFDDIHVRLQALIDLYSYQYSYDEEFVASRLSALRSQRKRRA